MTDIEDREQKEEIEKKVTARCWKDPEFRARFISNPTAAIKELGYESHTGAKIAIFEGKADTWNILLEPNPSNISKLSESELENVAGGMCTCTTTTRP